MVRKKAEGVWHTLSTDDYTLTMSVKYTSGSWSHMTQVLFLQASSTNVQVYYQVHNGWQVFRLWISFNITYPLATTSLINLSQTSCFSEWLKCWPVPQRCFCLSRPKTLAVEVDWGWMVKWGWMVEWGWKQSNLLLLSLPVGSQVKDNVQARHGYTVFLSSCGSQQWKHLQASLTNVQVYTKYTTGGRYTQSTRRVAGIH